MVPPIYLWLTSVSAIAAVVGDRVYGSGYAGQQGEPPWPDYIVFQLVAKDSPPYLGDDQDGDWDRVQVHCWSASEATAAALAGLCRDALNHYGNLVGGAIADYDAEVKMYRCGFDFGGWTDI